MHGDIVDCGMTEHACSKTQFQSKVSPSRLPLLWPLTKFIQGQILTYYVSLSALFLEGVIAQITLQYSLKIYSAPNTEGKNYFQQK